MSVLHDHIAVGVVVLVELLSALLLVAYHVLLLKQVHLGTGLVWHVVQVDLVDIRLVVVGSCALLCTAGVRRILSDVILAAVPCLAHRVNDGTWSIVGTILSPLSSGIVTSGTAGLSYDVAAASH